jgi:hypothetical protein
VHDAPDPALAVARKDGVDLVRPRQIALVVVHARALHVVRARVCGQGLPRERLDARERARVRVVEVVERDDLVGARGLERVHDVRADVARAARDEDALWRGRRRVSAGRVSGACGTRTLSLDALAGAAADVLGADACGADVLGADVPLGADADAEAMWAESDVVAGSCAGSGAG